MSPDLYNIPLSKMPSEDQFEISSTHAPECPSRPPPAIPTPLPPHLSHSPSSNQKVSDPFQFGSRYLNPDDDVFAFNAWDHVLPTPVYNTYAETQYDLQRSSPVSPYDLTRFNTAPEKWWDKFYTHNTANFFKNRKWLHQEFPILTEITRKDHVQPDGGKVRILEVGAGAGNTAFPILKANENPGLMIHACDFSPKAVSLIRNSRLYDPTHIVADVWDVASETQTLPPGLEPESVDVVILVFVFSALNPNQWAQAVRNIWGALRKGGEVCFRDYGRGDLAQVRFKKGRWMGENFYVRGDGTRVYFFSEEELRGIWGHGLTNQEVDEEITSGDVKILEPESEVASMDTETATDSTDEANSDTQSEYSTSTIRPFLPRPIFEITSLGVDRRLLVNRQKQLTMYRCWMQGRFRKPI